MISLAVVLVFSPFQEHYQPLTEQLNSELLYRFYQKLQVNLWLLIPEDLSPTFPKHLVAQDTVTRKKNLNCH